MNEVTKNNLLMGKPPPERVRFSVDVNRNFINKVKRPDMYAFNWTFQTEELTLDELVEDIQSGHAFTAPFAKVKHDDKKTPRLKKNVLEVQFLALDVETGDERSTLAWWNIQGLVALFGGVLYTTASHTEEDPRCRVVFLLERPVSVEEAELALKAFHHMFDFVDQSASDASRLFYGAEGCEVVVLGNVLPLDVLQEEVVQPYLDHLEEEQRQRDAERKKRTPRTGTTKANAGRWTAYVQEALDGELDSIANAKEGTGQRHKSLRDGSLRLYRLKKADWLDHEAKRLLDDLDGQLVDAARSNGYVRKYGEQDTRSLIASGQDMATPALQPERLPDRFDPGDTVVATAGPRRTEGKVTAVKQDQEGTWIYEVEGVWWSRCSLCHSTTSKNDELAGSDELVACEDDLDDINSAFVVQEDASDAVSTGKPPPEDELVEAFFQKVKGVQCTCTNKGSYIDIYLEHTSIAPNTNNNRRDCPYHRHKNAYRFTRQVEVEQRSQQMKLTRFASSEDWTRTRKKWNKRHERGADSVSFRPFFQQDGSVAVIHSCEDEAGQPLPKDNVEVLDVLTAILDNEHQSKRSRSSAGFGGHYSGTRGNSSKNKGDKYALQSNVFASRLAKEAFDVIPNTFGRSTVQRDCVDVFVNLSDFRNKELEQGRHIELDERWPQGMDNEVVRTIYNNELVKEVLTISTNEDALNNDMSSLMHNTTNTILCNKGDIPVVTQQQTLLFDTTSTLDEVEERAGPPPRQEEGDILSWYLQTMSSK